MTDRPHFDLRGSGPVLLVVPGGAGHPMGLDAMTDVLAEHFTVVTYDPLGLAHGRLGLPVPDQRVQDWSDGAHQVLQETLPEGESAYVLGTSSGGIAALDLLARHPQRLRHVVAHEPPCVAVLPDGDRQRAMFREVYDTYRASGLRAAAARLAAGLAEQEAGELPAGQPCTRVEELASPMALFLAHVLVPFTSYVPDLTSLPRSAPTSAPTTLPAPRPPRLTLAAGADSRGQLPHRTAGLVAERTGSPFVEFPGGHIGAASHAVAFAERLLKTLF
ncbi:alpha/beta fold hydrolase [Streptomyces sp. NBC_00076]|uniref:alpha/beta fold hydrolase n=1 Tax=Streptomyces sp. NBC_00076 TaxID=2975642 RepID=UPI00324DD042